MRSQATDLARRRAKGIYRIILRHRVRQRTNQLYAERNAASREIADALRRTLENRPPAEEQAWIGRIEALRKELNASTTPIQITDYGAGSPDGSLTDAEMYQGRVVVKTVGELCQGASKPPSWSLLLFRIVREFQPATCLELGTCLGISAAYQAAALELNGGGRLITLEGSPPSAGLAEAHLARLGLDNTRVVVGRFQDSLDEVLRQRQPIDYAFIDGHHDEKATIAYFQQIIPSLAERAVLVFDDVSWSAGMRRAWGVIEQDPRVKVSIDLGRMGIAIVDGTARRKQALKLPLVL